MRVRVCVLVCRATILLLCCGDGVYWGEYMVPRTCGILFWAFNLVSLCVCLGGVFVSVCVRKTRRCCFFYSVLLAAVLNLRSSPAYCTFKFPCGWRSPQLSPPRVSRQRCLSAGTLMSRLLLFSLCGEGYPSRAARRPRSSAFCLLCQ